MKHATLSGQDHNAVHPKFGLAPAILCLTLFSHTLFALPSDREQVAQLAANNAELNQQTHSSHYHGDVRFSQGTTQLQAAKVNTLGDEKNKITFAVAFGNQTAQAHYAEQIAENKPLLHAYADEIRYYPLTHIIELIGHAKVMQGDDSFSAPMIRYDTIKQHVISTNKGLERTVIILHPDKKAGKHL